MIYHHELWITVGTVAPVVALAHAVNLGTFLRRAERADRAGSASRRTEIEHTSAELNRLATQLQQSDWTTADRAITEANLDALERVRRESTQVAQLAKEVVAADVESRRRLRSAFRAELLTLFSWFFCTSALVLALTALGLERDFLPWQAGAAMVELPLAALVVAAIFEATWGNGRRLS